MIFHLISSPRNISTALMYSFYHRGDTAVVDEPFYAYYLDRATRVHPGQDEILAQMEKEPSRVIAGINDRAAEKSHLFIKNMAHHLVEMPLDFLVSYRNILLIRDPKQLIASFAQVLPNPRMEDVGIKRQHEIFQFLGSGKEFAVIDSGELLKDPPKYLEALCEVLNIPFSLAMHQWQPGPIPDDGVWAKFWYKNVHQSEGFMIQKTSQRELPSECEPLYKEALPYYHELSKYALKI